MNRPIAFVAVAASCAGALLLACGDAPIEKSKGAPPPPVTRAASTPDSGLAPTKVLEFTENDFVESDHERDPFRSYATLFIEKNTHVIKNQLAVILPQYSIDELKLVAIVTGGEYPRAMLVDPTGKGWVVKRGDYLGRPDIVHTGRVRDGDVVLNREDRASNGAVPVATRVIPLHPEADKAAENDQQQQRL